MLEAILEKIPRVPLPRISSMKYFATISALMAVFGLSDPAESKDFRLNWEHNCTPEQTNLYISENPIAVDPDEREGPYAEVPYPQSEYVTSLAPNTWFIAATNKLGSVESDLSNKLVLVFDNASNLGDYCYMTAKAEQSEDWTYGGDITDTNKTLSGIQLISEPDTGEFNVNIPIYSSFLDDFALVLLDIENYGQDRDFDVTLIDREGNTAEYLGYNDHGFMLTQGMNRVSLNTHDTQDYDPGFDPNDVHTIRLNFDSQVPIGVDNEQLIIRQAAIKDVGTFISGFLAGIFNSDPDSAYSDFMQEPITARFTPYAKDSRRGRYSQWFGSFSTEPINEIHLDFFLPTDLYRSFDTRRSAIEIDMGGNTYDIEKGELTPGDNNLIRVGLDEALSGQIDIAITTNYRTRLSRSPSYDHSWSMNITGHDM